MQRQRKADRLRDVVHEALEARQPADGRDRCAAMRDAEVGQPGRCAEDVVEVEHRLAHAHEDGMRERPEAAEVERLVEDLGRREIPPEPHLTRGAERARQRAAGLRGEAERAPPVAVRHEHGLDRMAVVRREERLHGAVARARLGLDFERREGDVLLERLSQPDGYVRHRPVVGSAARRPLPDLACAVRRLSAGGERLLEQVEVHPLRE